ncbi:MAG: hypothetical protein JST55_03500 [Bacteroidetes bacterium]|nr:hypothetical protein [Bacteroidota bacterium]
MIQVKAIRILSSLTKEEFAEFDKFVQSPYFNRSKDVLNLFFEIKKYYPEFSHPKLDYEKIYKKLYPGKLYAEGTIRNLFSDLGSLAEKFLGYVNYENTFEFGHKILEETNARYLEKEFLKNYNKYYERNEIKEDALYRKNLNKCFIESEMLLYEQRININLNESLRKSVSEALFSFFLNEFLLAQSCHVKVADWYKGQKEFDIVETFFEFSDIESIVNRMKDSKSAYYDDIKLPYYLAKVAQNKDGNFYNNFEEAYKIFNEQINSMGKQSQIRIYVWVINIINMYIKADDKHLSTIKFQVEKEMIEKGLALDSKGKMPGFMYSQIIHDAIAANEIEWAKDFWENQIDAVDDDAIAKNDIYTYYKAKFLSLDKKYIESNEILLKVSKDDDTFKAASKILKLINFYELGELESAFAHAEAFKQMIIRNDEAYTGRKELSSNFLKYYLVLLKNKSGKETDISFVKKELKECDVIRNKVWLLEKFEEISNILPS